MEVGEIDQNERCPRKGSHYAKYDHKAPGPRFSEGKKSTIFANGSDQ